MRPVFALALAATLSFVCLGQSKPKKGATPPSDDAIHQCITDKVAHSSKLKGYTFTYSVTNGEATLIGVAKKKDQQKEAAKIAKGCGARTVTNSITLEPAAQQKTSKPPKGEQKAAKP